MLRWSPISFLVVFLDQWTKSIAVDAMSLGDRISVFPYFSWVRWHNEGAAFSFLANAGGWQRWFFVVLGFFFVLFLVNELRNLKERFSTLHLIYTLIIGGAVGNTIDRLVNGYVVDFILVHYDQYYFPAFNVADSALTLGAVMWAIILVKEMIQEKRVDSRENES